MIKTALENSDSYRIIGLKYKQANLEQMSLSSEMDTVLFGETNYNDDNTVKTLDFQAARSRKSDWNLGFSKNGRLGRRLH